jgi:hypothetical protein
MISPTHQRAIAAAIPDDVEVPNAFWRDLNFAIDLYQAQRERRRVKPSVKERKRWEHIEDLAHELHGEICAAKKGIFWEHCDDPMWPNRMLVALGEIQHRAEAYRLGYEAMGTGFNRRANPPGISCMPRSAICGRSTYSGN